VVQEALNNIAKHAATRVVVSVDREESTVVVRVDDDGCGFSPDTQPNQRSGLGLVGMRERAQIVGGTIDVHTAPGKGTRVRLRVPLEPAAHQGIP
jgi:signal transduction histidine kinase